MTQLLATMQVHIFEHQVQTLVYQAQVPMDQLLVPVLQVQVFGHQVQTLVYQVQVQMHQF